MSEVGVAVVHQYAREYEPMGQDLQTKDAVAGEKNAHEIANISSLSSGQIEQQ